MNYLRDELDRAMARVRELELMNDSLTVANDRVCRERDDQMNEAIRLQARVRELERREADWLRDVDGAEFCTPAERAVLDAMAAVDWASWGRPDAARAELARREKDHETQDPVDEFLESHSLSRREKEGA